MILMDYFKLAKVFSCCNSFDSRKKVQKIIYILKEMGYPFNEKFDFHFYGPYSQELALEIETLSYMGILKETKEENQGWNQYSYQITDNGKKWAEKCQDNELNNIEDIVRTLNNKTARELELIATILYFKNLSKEEIIHKIYELKADKNYSENEIKNAFNFIKEKLFINSWGRQS